ncbi:hypothetical protein [Rhodococcus erythropolis]|uniref:hypothetical protein n=1 Tax=Rhodococcus erythropolis TaxID=1833 RepID=UPI00036F1C5E|nr:hypothetical protein [Rhodococcus erythropolis]ORI30219.1 hypothetical protein BH686_01535 [Rhodococcus erythropolis]
MPSGRASKLRFGQCFHDLGRDRRDPNIASLNFPSAGAAFPADFLPGFLSGLSHFWIGAGAMDAARSIVYFGSTGIGHGLLILGGWLLMTVPLVALTHRRKPTPTTFARTRFPLTDPTAHPAPTQCRP